MKKFIKNKLRESISEGELLDEDITSGSITVYHRTGDESIAKGIAKDGYRVGSGAMYGVGVYTTYDLDSQLRSNMRDTYGNIIIESKVLSMDKFLIFDYDQAKKIYGNKNYRLDRQLRIILGNEWSKYKDDPNMKSLIEKISVVKYTSDVAVSFVKKYSDIVNKLNGIVFTGSRDGKVLISYVRTNVEPTRYSTDEGETWINVLNKDIYKRQKGYDKEGIGSGDEHIKNKLDAGVSLSYDEFMKLDNNQKSRYLNSGVSISYDIFKTLDDDVKLKYINRVGSDSATKLIKSSDNQNEFIDKLLNIPGFIDDLDLLGVRNLLGYASNVDGVIKTLLSNDTFIDNLDDNVFKRILSKSSNPDKLKSYIKNKRSDLVKQNESRNLIKNLLREGLFNENETVRDFYNRFNKEQKDTPWSEFLINNFRNPNFELRLTQGGGVRSGYCYYSEPNKCETNTFEFIKNEVSEDEHRYYPVSGWVFFKEGSFYEHFWVYDAIDDMFIDITPMKNGELIYAYAGVINKNINKEIINAETYREIDFLLGKSAESLYDNKYSKYGNHMDKESKPKLDNYQHNNKSIEEKIFDFIHKTKEYSELSDFIQNNNINTLEGLNGSISYLKEKQYESRNNRDYDYYQKLINQINFLNKPEIKQN